MTQPNDGDPTGGTGGKTFTEAQLNDIVRDRLARERKKLTEQYADYEELKAAAEAAKASEGTLAKMEKQLADLSARNEKLDHEAMIRRVADKLKISVSQAERLRGKTEQELLDDGEDFYKDWPGRKNTGGESNAEGEGEDGKGKGTASSGDDDRGRPAGNGSGGQRRPREEGMRSGAPVGDGDKEETNPAKLAALIPR